MAKPFRPSYASAHQPSSTERFKPPFKTTFLAAGSGGFQRTPRIVQPDIDTLRQMAADVDVIVFDEDEFVGKLRVAHQLRNLLQDALARFVERMRLCRQTQTAPDVSGH